MHASDPSPHRTPPRPSNRRSWLPTMRTPGRNLANATTLPPIAGSQPAPLPAGGGASAARAAPRRIHGGAGSFLRRSSLRDFVQL